MSAYVLTQAGLRVLVLEAGRAYSPETETPIAPGTRSISASEPADTLAEPLTAREIEVLELLGKGFSAKSIGRSLDISPTTAKWHLKNVYGKLGAISREDALARARQFHIIR